MNHTPTRWNIFVRQIRCSLSVFHHNAHFRDVALFFVVEVAVEFVDVALTESPTSRRATPAGKPRAPSRGGSGQAVPRSASPVRGHRHRERTARVDLPQAQVVALREFDRTGPFHLPLSVSKTRSAVPTSQSRRAAATPVRRLSRLRNPTPAFASTVPRARGHRRLWAPPRSRVRLRPCRRLRSGTSLARRS
jgi:hypothetical protein